VLSVVEQNLINEGADVVKQMGATFCFNISAGDQTRSFFVDLKRLWEVILCQTSI